MCTLCSGLFQTFQFRVGVLGQLDQGTPVPEDGQFYVKKEEGE